MEQACVPAGLVDVEDPYGQILNSSLFNLVLYSPVAPRSESYSLCGLLCSVVRGKLLALNISRNFIFLPGSCSSLLYCNSLTRFM